MQFKFGQRLKFGKRVAPGLLFGAAAVQAVPEWFRKKTQQPKKAREPRSLPAADPLYDYATKMSPESDSWSNIYAGRMDTERVIPLAEVKQHTTVENRIWMTFEGEVFDMTPFSESHPGLKSRLLMSAGNDLLPYWEVYNDHLRGHVVPFLKKFKIGNLTKEDAERAKDFHFPNQYDTDPVRHPDLLACTYHPFNGECLLERLTEKYYTPNELHYVRTHLAVPVVEEEDYELEVRAGNGLTRSKTYSLQELKDKFKWYDVVSTIQCAGNRREDFHGYPRADGTDNYIFIGPHWVVGAIGCAKWTGVRLRDVLEDCGLDVDSLALGKKKVPGKHVLFEALDCDETGLNFGVSIPIDKAVDGLGDCILAFKMNGQELPRDHGYPIRAVVPGFAGARNCKWLTEISLGTTPNPKPWQQIYRGFGPDVTFQDELYTWQPGEHKKLSRLEDHAPIIEEQPVQSMVCNPPPNATLGGKGVTEVEVRGVAWSGGGRGINRVDVSIDGGATFHSSECFKPPDLEAKEVRMRQWGWYHFYKRVPLSSAQKMALKRGEKIEIDCVSKAVNGDYNVQPETPGPVYNARGCMINHYYHVPAYLDGRLKEGTIIRNDERDRQDRFRNKPSGGKFMMPWKNPDGSQDEEVMNASEANEAEYRKNIWWEYSEPPVYAEEHIDY